MRQIRLGNRIVGGDHPAFIIAEAGINHQGDLNIARELIDTAMSAGADAVKFQKRAIHRVWTRGALERPHLDYASFGKTCGEHWEALELTEDEYRALKKHADDHGIIFLASGWDEESMDFLDELGVPAFSVASADLTNAPLLEHTAKKGKPVMLSTGMASIEDVQRAYDIVQACTDDIAILQCTSTYPSKFEHVNLRVIQTFADRFDAVIGYSGHELGIVVPVAAVALGAKIVERHLTLDRAMKGSDHAASLEPNGLTRMVRDIRHIEEAMGSGIKKIVEDEIPMKRELGKSLVSTRAITKGTTITRDMLTAKSPGNGIAPWRINDIVERKAATDIEVDVMIHDEDICR